MSSETRMRHKSDPNINQDDGDNSDLESSSSNSKKNHLQGDKSNICLLLLLYLLQGKKKVN